MLDGLVKLSFFFCFEIFEISLEAVRFKRNKF